MLIFFNRYEEKRWIPRGRKAKSPSSVTEEEKESLRKIGVRSGGYKHVNNVNHVTEKKKITHPPVTNNTTPTTKSCLQVHVYVPQKVRMVSVWSYTLIVSKYISYWCSKNSFCS